IGLTLPASGGSTFADIIGSAAEDGAGATVAPSDGAGIAVSNAIGVAAGFSRVVLGTSATPTSTMASPITGPAPQPCHGRRATTRVDAFTGARADRSGTSLVLASDTRAVDVGPINVSEPGLTAIVGSSAPDRGSARASSPRETTSGEEPCAG